MRLGADNSYVYLIGAGVAEIATSSGSSGGIGGGGNGSKGNDRDTAKRTRAVWRWFWKYNPHIWIPGVTWRSGSCTFVDLTIKCALKMD